MPDNEYFGYISEDSLFFFIFGSTGAFHKSLMMNILSIFWRVDSIFYLQPLEADDKYLESWTIFGGLSYLFTFKWISWV